MSVGGIVIGVTVVGDEAHVSTAELACWKKTGPKLDLLNATAVRVRTHGHTVYPGDILWWQGGRAMLSPRRFRHLPDAEKRAGTHYDIVLERLGYSHESFVPHVGSELEELADERCREQKESAR